ncbi:hypothetical protein NLG97_g3611 [Lecanicillium saksenae]|uniref:Uncharacterized protein n=1 Tax=Lecanicillium saksenae TaxID=468837 RepID=A0ACC1QYT0_9HYPO|nr:hypothetical protein NLG97_g3611 [Lecanicillium saksenae]
MKQQLAACVALAQAVAGLSAYDYNTPGSNQVRFWVNDDSDDTVVTQMPFLTGTGFATLPISDCFSDDDSEESRYDIAILGAPHDTTTTGRPGARFGPPAIRLGSNQKTYGLSVYNNAGEGAQEDFRPAAKSSNTSSVPRIITLGGDHTTTLAALRATEKHWGPVSVIHFDSHVDTWDPKQLGGGISEYAALNHGTFLHFAHEENLILNSSIHAGIRAQVTDESDMRHDKECGFHIITARDIDFIGVKGIIDSLRKRVEGTRVYISIDIDVLDPAFAPATGTPEAGGWSSRELLTILAGLDGLEVIGGDVVEVAPPYDNNAATTALAAAEVAFAVLELMVSTPVKSLAFSHDGAIDEENTTHQESNHLLSKKIERGRRAYLVALQWWADEYKSAIICGLSIIILSIVLWYFDGKLVPHLSPGLDLDMVVIALVTVCRVAMGNIVEACISQCAWIWIAKSHQLRTNTVARLEDFKLFDEASRGHLSCIGAAIIILTHGFETFSQQMVDYVEKPVIFKKETERSAPANYRSDHWDNVEQRD